MSFNGDLSTQRWFAEEPMCPFGIELCRRLLESSETVSLLGVSSETADCARGIKWWLEYSRSVFFFVFSANECR